MIAAELTLMVAVETSKNGYNQSDHANNDDVVARVVTKYATDIDPWFGTLGLRVYAELSARACVGEFGRATRPYPPKQWTSRNDLPTAVVVHNLPLVLAVAVSPDLVALDDIGIRASFC